PEFYCYGEAVSKASRNIVANDNPISWKKKENNARIVSGCTVAMTETTYRSWRTNGCFNRRIARRQQ
ncbi:MAG: hypothetical protein LBR86_07645, partial [Tannerella sp.]|nr:hypothetical protein [Tannerella sp.]